MKTDLAIQGPGFFILSDGVSNVYTRAGVFGLDSENNLVNPTHRPARAGRDGRRGRRASATVP